MLAGALMGFKVTMEKYQKGEEGANFCKFKVTLSSVGETMTGRDVASSFYKLPFVKHCNLQPNSQREQAFLQCKLLSFKANYPQFEALNDIFSACKEQVETHNRESGRKTRWFIADDNMSLSVKLNSAVQILSSMDMDVSEEGKVTNRKSAQMQESGYPQEYVDRVNEEFRKYAEAIRT